MSRMISPSFSIESYLEAMASQKLSSCELIDACLSAANDVDGEGSRVFIRIDEDAARQAAEEQDGRSRSTGGRLRGLPISIKDLFDQKGETTAAGSLVLRNEPEAQKDSAVAARLKQAGAILIGRTNMTEFAYSGLGLNPHYGTPRNPYRRGEGRIPGGSSSGAAISVADGMAVAAVGSDTGGSLRIPAALCGLTGYKPTACRVPSDGAFPLSTTLDSFGAIAASVRCCATIDEVLSGEELAFEDVSPRQIRLAILQGYVLDGLDIHVTHAFEHAIALLSAAGFVVEDFIFDQLNAIPECNRQGGFAAAEAYRLHQHWIRAGAKKYDPRVLARIMKGADISAEDYAALRRRRQEITEASQRKSEGIDLWLMPTVPRIAPRICDLEEDDAAYGEANLAMLRNPSIINFLDGCAISLPCHAWGEAPVGLMLAARNGQDAKLLSIALAIEDVLAQGGCAIQGRFRLESES